MLDKRPSYKYQIMVCMLTSPSSSHHSISLGFTEPYKTPSNTGPHQARATVRRAASTATYRQGKQEGKKVGRRAPKEQNGDSVPPLQSCKQQQQRCHTRTCTSEAFGPAGSVIFTATSSLVWSHLQHQNNLHFSMASIYATQ